MEMKRILLSFLMLASSIAFGLGITLPIIKLEKLYFFSETPSILEVIGGLWEDGSFLLSAVVLLFSVLFPILKLSVVFVDAVAHQSTHQFSASRKWLSILSKWSMMDVILVAIAVFAAKTTGLATAIALPGIWFYCASAIGGTICAFLLSSPDAVQEGSKPSGS